MTGTGIVKVVCGCGVGRTVGTTVGATVGTAVGTTVGVSAGATVGSGVAVVVGVVTGVGMAPVSARNGRVPGRFGIADPKQPPATQPGMTMPAATATAH